MSEFGPIQEPDPIALAHAEMVEDFDRVLDTEGGLAAIVDKPEEATPTEEEQNNG